MADIGIIVGGVKVARSIAAFLEFTKSEIAGLKANEFDTAIRMLEDARHSDGEQEHLLRSARDHFTRAVGFETDLRLAETHLGLAMCHHHLGDHSNSRRALAEIMDVTFPYTKFLKALARDNLVLYLGGVPWVLAWRHLRARKSDRSPLGTAAHLEGLFSPATIEVRKQERKLEALQDAARATLER